MDWQLCWTVVITGLVVVFVVLICLTYIIKGYGAIINGIQTRHSKNNRPDVPAPEQKPAAADLAPSASPASEEGIPQEIAAAIAAAAVYCAGPDAVVTHISRAPRQAGSAWRTAGLLENTRPF